ncbi:MAG: ATP-binding cassette domain-containing protein [Gammaproteobacteria bacterium]
MIELDVHYRRGGFRLEAKVHLESGVTGIVGPSGCGKSTLLALLAGLRVPEQGRIVFQDDVLFDATRGTHVPPWQRGFAVVFQDGQLFPHLNVRDKLLYGYRRRAPAERRFQLADAVDLLGIDALLTRRPAALSGGERQRVALGRALLSAPRLLLLDEPLAALDQALKLQILPYLERLKREAGLPMLYVTHAPAELATLADRVLTMTPGRILTP